MDAKSQALLDTVLGYQNSLVAFFTGSKLDEADYAALRQDLLGNAIFSDLVPTFLRRHRDLGSLWSYAKSVDPSYEGRRQFLRAQFEPLLDRLETNALSPEEARSGPYDASEWTGMHSPAQKLIAVRTLVPVAQAAVETLIAQLEMPSHNGGPPLDGIEEALVHLKKLHGLLGAILDAADAGSLSSDTGEGLLTEAARYAKRAARAVRDDPVPYALSGLLLAVLTAAGFPTIAPWLSGVAISIRKAHS